MTESLAVRDPAGIMERAVIQGDLSELTSAERVEYYARVCESLGLNPYTKPFEYLSLDNGTGGKKLVLYARKDCADQLRDIKKVSIVRLEKERTEDLYIVTAHAVLPDGRTDSAVGAVSIAKEGGYWDDVKDRQGKPLLKEDGKPKKRFVSDGSYVPLSGDALANAIMKAETKAKRRVTLSICGLGMTDESEIDSIAGAARIEGDYPAAAALPSATVEVISSADNRVWKRWLEVIATAHGLGIPVEEIRLPMALVELQKRGQALIDAIEERKKQLAEQEAAAAAGKAAHDAGQEEALPDFDDQGSSPPEASPKAKRAELWAENRRLIEEAHKRGLHGPTLNIRSTDDVLIAANTELQERIANYDVDQQFLAMPAATL